MATIPNGDVEQKFQAMLATLLAVPFALYTFSGVEFVAVTSGEARSTRDIARATRLTFVILTLVYIGAIVVLTGVMPWNHAGVSESPSWC